MSGLARRNEFSINSVDSGGNIKYSRCKKCTCCLIPLSILAVIVLISTLIGLRFTMGNSYSNHGQNYAPTDTRLIPFSNSFCQSLRLKTNYDGSNKYNLSFYMLTYDPGLLEQENFSIIERIENGRYYAFYMHSGSEITVSACFSNDTALISSANFYIVKGVDGYNGAFLKPVVARFAISDYCSNDNMSFSYFIEDSDFYYFIFRTSRFGLPVFALNVNISLHLTRYSLYNNTVISSCSLSTSDYGSTCSLSIPLSTDSYSLLTIQPSDYSDVEWLDEIPLETSCVPRLWVYIVPPILLIILLIPVGLCCCCIGILIPWKWLNFRCKKLIYFCIPYSLLIILIGVYVGLRLNVIDHYYFNYGQSSAPNDTRLIPFSRTFCQSLKLRTNYNGSDEYSVSFYMLPYRPELNDDETFFISEEIVSEIRYHYLFYMNSGSTVIINTCFANASAVIPRTSLYVAKGISGYNGGYRRSDIRSVVAERAISYDCSRNSSTLFYSVRDDDFYYFIYHTNTLGTISELHLETNMSFDLTQYAVIKNNITSSCHLSTSDHGSTCSLSVPLPFPYNFNYRALLTVQPVSSDVDRLDRIPLETQCVTRVWMYIVPTILVTILVVFLSSCYCWMSTTRIKLASQPEADNVEEKFKKAWVKGSTPVVKRVFVIKNNGYRKLKWYTHRLSHFFNNDIEKYYHGTQLQCDILHTNRLCYTTTKCGVCRISDSGFDAMKIRKNITFQRFGRGFYLAPNSSKCHDYTKGAYGCRAIFLCDVCPGKKYEIKKNNPDLKGPPKGYNCIYGKSGQSLTYDEIVLPFSAMILPRYIIVYEKDGVDKLIK